MKLLFTFLILTTTTISSAQFTLKYSSTISNFDPNGYNKFEDIVFSDEGVIGVGTWRVPGPQLYGVTVALDSNGIELWRDTTTVGHIAGNAKILRKDQLYYSFGQHEDSTGVDNIHHQIFTSGGTLLQQPVYNSMTYQFTHDGFDDAEFDSNGDLLVGGNGWLGTSQKPILLKYDDNGTLLYDSTLNLNGSGNIMDIAVNGTDVYAAIFSFYGNPVKMYLAKYDQNGDTLWMKLSKSYTPQTSTCVAANSSGYAALAGNMAAASGIELYRPNGDTAFFRTIDSVKGISTIYGDLAQIQIDEDANIYVYCNAEPYNSVICKFDSTGTMLWADTLQKHSFNYRTNRELMVIEQNHVYLTGTYINPKLYVYNAVTGARIHNYDITYPGHVQFYPSSMLVNSSGDVCLAGVDRLASNNFEGVILYLDYDFELQTNELEGREIKIYPNPVQDQMRLDTKESVKNLRVFSANGQLIESPKYNNGVVRLDNFYGTGTYILQIELESGVLVNKQFTRVR